MKSAEIESQTEVELIGARITADDKENDHYTAHPIFLVQQRRRFYGLDPNYCDNVAWLHEDEAVEVTADLAAHLERGYRGTEPEGYRRTAYFDSWEFVQCFFTRQGAEDYIASQRHNLKDARVYVDSGHRNPEWQAVRAHLRGLNVDRENLSSPLFEDEHDVRRAEDEYEKGISEFFDTC